MCYKIKGKSPCANCPYRTDAPKQLWAIEEFIDLIKNEKDQFGTVYGCHKKNGTVCKGWLINQDKNNLPSIALRLQLSKQNISRKYLDSLHSPVPIYTTIRKMSEANYPQLKYMP